MRNAMSEGWVVIDFGDYNHIVPENEVDDHQPTGCRCNPSEDIENETIVIHNSFDGREAFERGERLPS